MDLCKKPELTEFEFLVKILNIPTEIIFFSLSISKIREKIKSFLLMIEKLSLSILQ